MKDFQIDIAEAQKLSKWIIDLRRTIHSRPEISYQEKETAKVIADSLQQLNLEVSQNVYGTGVIGLLRGKQNGPTVALRADIDALPLKELTDVPYKSLYDGQMHACGHDGHTAILLGTARLLNGVRDDIQGNVKFIFQPAEEVPPAGGARGLIDLGVLENPHVDAIFGLHIWPDLPSGSIGVKSGSLMAAPDRFTLLIKGKGGHGAAPHQVNDTIVTAAQIISNLQTVVSRNIDPLSPVVLSICRMAGGTAYNIFPEEVVLEGTTRYFEKKLGPEIESMIQQKVDGICQANGCTFELNYQYGFPPTVNDAKMAAIVTSVATRVLEPGNVVSVENPSMTGDDFGIYLQHIPGCFFWLGTRNPEKDVIYPLHSSHFNLDESILPLGALLMSNIALEYLFCNSHDLI